MKTCPFCKNDFQNAAHIYHCNNRPRDSSKKELKEKYILFKYKDIDKTNFINEYNSLFSLVDLRTKYGIDFKASLFLLKFWNVDLRSLKDSANKISKIKSEKTCLEKYGAKSNFSKDCDGYNKRIKTLKEKYNVENIFQVPEIKAKCMSDETYVERFGLTRKQKRKKEAKERYASLTQEEKIEFLNRSLLSKKSIHSGAKSKLELVIQDILNKIGVEYITHHRMLVNDRISYIYDILIVETKIIIEINGDYWHANPNKYKAEDMVNYPHGLIMAKDVWEKDKKKRDHAINNGFRLYYIWESFIKSNDLETIKNHILELIFSEDNNEN